MKELDHKSDKHSKKLKKHKDLLKEHTEEIDKLKKKKVDQEIFDHEITFIKNLLNKYSGDKIDLSDISGQFTPSEVSKLWEVINDYPETSKNVEKILNDLKKYDLSKLKDHLAFLEDLINKKADKTELGPIKDDINQLWDLIKKL